MGYENHKQRTVPATADKQQSAADRPAPDRVSEEKQKMDKERELAAQARAAEEKERDQAVKKAVEEARKVVLEAVKDGLVAVEKAVREGKKAVKAAHGAKEMLPLFHDERLGGLIDDSWTIVRLLELALPAEAGPSKRDIPGLDGELGAFPYPVNDKELQLVRDAATEFIKLVKSTAEVGSRFM
jgi:hypothetical protein